MRKRSKANKKRGLTLIELVAALAVIAIAAGIAVVSFGAVERRALYDASRALATDLRFAQRMAMIEGRRWGIDFDQAGNRYFVMHVFPTETVKTVEFSNGVLLRSSTYEGIYFLPRGTSQRGMTIWLSKGNYMQRITVLPSGGRVDIKEMVYSPGGVIPPSGD